jgi:hypothetical protein
MAAARGKTGAKGAQGKTGAKGEEYIPYAVARQANRAIFYRYLAILAIVSLGGLAAFSINSSRISSTEDPCSVNLHGQVCQTRSCERAADVHFTLTPYCRGLLGRVKRGEIDAGVGSNGKRFVSPSGSAAQRQAQGGGGSGNGGGSAPDGGQGGAPSGTTSTPPAQAPPVNVGVPGLPSVCVGGVGGVNC